MAAISRVPDRILPAASGTLVAGERHADPELEALLPTTLGGVALTVESQAGTELATNSAAFDAFLAEPRQDARRFLAGQRLCAAGGSRPQVGAWRVKGADPALLLPGFRTAVQASSTTPLTKAERDRRAGARSPASAIPAS